MNDSTEHETPPPPDAAPVEDSADLIAAPAVLTMTVTITRKKTGKTETYHLVGTADDDNPERR